MKELFKENVKIIRPDEEMYNTSKNVDSVYSILLKLDTHGFDPAFNGAKGILDDVKAIQSELPFIKTYEEMPDAIVMLDTYRKEGFRLCGTRDVSGALIEGDGLFVRTG